MENLLFTEYQPVTPVRVDSESTVVAEAYGEMSQTKCRGGDSGTKCGGLPSVDISGDDSNANGEDKIDKPPMSSTEAIIGNMSVLDSTQEIDPEDITYVADLLTEHGDFRNDFKRSRVEQILGRHIEEGNAMRLIANINEELQRRGSDLHLNYDSKYDSGRHGFSVSPPSTTHTLSVIKPGEEEPEDVVSYVEWKNKVLRF